jgi:hypothetical protein
VAVHHVLEVLDVALSGLGHRQSLAGGDDDGV